MTSSDQTPYYFDQPKILINPDQLSEFYPTRSLPPARLVNSIARFIIYFSLVYFLLTSYVIIFPLMLLALWVLKMYASQINQYFRPKSEQSGRGSSCCGDTTSTSSYSDLRPFNQVTLLPPGDSRLYQSLDQNWNQRNHQSEINHPPGDPSDFGKFLFKDAKCDREAAITRFDKQICYLK